MSTPLGPATGTYAPPTDSPAESVVLVPPTADRKSIARVDLPSPPLTAKAKVAEVGDDWSTDMEARRFMARALGCSVCGGGVLMPRDALLWTCPGCRTEWVRPAYLHQVKPMQVQLDPPHGATVPIPDLPMHALVALDAHLRAAITTAEAHRDIELAAKLLPARIEAGREIARRRALAGEPAGEPSPGRGDGTSRC